MEMDKRKINFIDDETVKIWNEQFKMYNEFEVLFRRTGYIRVRSKENTTSGPYFFCEDTKNKNPAIFMLKDEIWNEITPDFDSGTEGINIGFLSLEAANQRACKHLGRSLRKDDFRQDDYRNDALLFVFNVLT